MPGPRPTDPIGILDSGVGGLSVLRHIRAQLPAESLLYVADQAHVPYGSRPAAEIQAFSAGITRYLLERRARVIVVACNTATAAALTYLRAQFPDVPFVGMEPAVKPAAALTHSGKVGVLATPGTFGSSRYATLMARYARDVAVIEDPCLGLVPLIESGAVAAPKTERLLRRIVEPMLAAGVDTLVLGCTHYPFVRPLLETILDGRAAIIDPAPAVARQTGRVLQTRDLLATGSEAAVQLVTTGPDGPFRQLSARLLGVSYPVTTAVWHNSVLTSAQDAV